jgi:predicted ATPase/class 3 adenylate cyclase
MVGAMPHDLRVRLGLPTGTVTFLFTDVEGSTRLLEKVGAEAYATALAEHRRLILEACAAHGGVVVDTEGDALFVAFPTAPGAVAASQAARDALASNPVQVRMGLHTGTPLLTETGYVGMDVHRAARIAAAAHAGQVVLSASTRALVDYGLALVDLGEHRFKDLAAAERVFQLGEGVFPPLRSLHRSNLPVPATPFLGREAELAAVVALLRQSGMRLVSLVGPGGTGKTRLGLQAAAEASDSYPDGVFWASLAPLRDPALVLPTVAAALGVSEERDGSAVDDLAQGLAGRRPLVLIDNVEHLLPDAAETLASFVTACPEVTIVLTSRERLQIPGERVYAVPPMSESDAETLFQSRAADAGVELEASDELRTLCGRLDNLPLALELAAARTVVFSPGQLLERLARPLDLLKAGRGVDERQETLRGTIAWSHDLLTVEEQTLFRRMSVFAGDCRFESAEQIAGADPDVLQSLLDKSLLRRRDSKAGPRFWMLETIREFAAEQLEAAGETDDLQRRHLEHYAAVAEACFDETLQFHDDLDRLEEEHENLRLALDAALKTDAELALELARRLVPSWAQRGEFREGSERLAAALAGAPDTSTPARAWALQAAAILAGRQKDPETANRLGSEALSLFHALGDRRGAAATLITLGVVALNSRRDYGEARRLFEEAVDLLDGPGDEEPQRRARSALTWLMSVEGDHGRALTLHREDVAYARREGSTLSLAIALNNLYAAQALAGEMDEARRSLEESVALLREVAHKPALANGLCNLAHVKLTTAPAEALAHYSESLRLCLEIDDPETTVYCLQGGAAIFAARGDHTHAATLLGAASRIHSQTGLILFPTRQAEADTLKAECRQALTTEAFTRAWDDGAALDAAAAVEWALHYWEAWPPSPPTSPT